LAVLIPTYNEGIEVLTPTIAAAVAMRLAHETWVLDDGDRPAVADLARALGARYLARPEHAQSRPSSTAASSPARTAGRPRSGAAPGPWSG
jgi:cellulose synthase/poly-beta-1,6-N-acetylglucosamine synthase-like glycosyltransferase